MSNNNLELINTALKERIGIIVSNYESDMANLRAEASMIIENLTEQNRNLTQEVANLKVELQEDSNVAVQKEK